MKKLIVTIAAVMVSLSAFAADLGQVNFTTRVAPDLDAKVAKPDGSAPGPGFTAQAYIVKPDSSLDPLLPTTNFRTGGSANNPFWLNAVVANAPANYAPGDTVKLMFRVWDGPSFESPASAFGQSQTIDYKLGGGTITPPNPTWGGFTLTPVTTPEPSTIALAALGGAALFIRRRK